MGGGGGGLMRWSVFGYYGLGSVNPSDINTLASQAGTTPKLGSVTNNTIYGGGLGYRMTPRIQFIGEFDIQEAKSLTTTSSPSIANAGFDLSQDEVWAIINYSLIMDKAVEVYVGAGVGYPTYCHLNYQSTVMTQYDAVKTVGFLGQAGIRMMLGRIFNIYFEGGYQSLVSTTLNADVGGAPLTTATGSNAKMDMSGVRGEAGLTINF